MPNTPTENTVYCLHVTDVCKTANADIVSFEFGKIKYTGDIPTNTEEIDGKYPFLLKQSSEATENGMGVYPYGAIVQKIPDELPGTGAKLHVVPCGNISHLPETLMDSFITNGHLETDDEIPPSMCHVGDIFTIGAPDKPDE